LQVYIVDVVVNHHGKGAQGGHYTCDVLHGDQWLRFDDSVVEPIDSGIVSSRQKDRQAYILFYKRQGL
jgi:ubiquitin carboxyl-terminal hydrolase 10